jgi:hypothetical protein
MMTALNRSVTLVKARKMIILAVIGVVKDRQQAGGWKRGKCRRGILCHEDPSSGLRATFSRWEKGGTTGFLAQT